MEKQQEQQKRQENYKIITNITEDMRKILSQIPNKNSLYRDIGLNTTYLNLKHFIAGKEKLKEKSEDALLNKLGYKKVTLYVKEDDLSIEEKTYINVLQVKFLEELNNYIQKFLGERKRFTRSDLNKNELEELTKKLNEAKEYSLEEIGIDMNNLNIEIKD